jgi:hypothetical protein
VDCIFKENEMLGKRCARWMGAVAALFLLAPTQTQATIIIPSTVYAQSEGTNWQLSFQVTAKPDAQTGPFQTLDITTDNGRYGTHLSAPGSKTTGAIFTSLSDLIASLPNQWTIKLDAGLATQRVYTSTLSIGTLASATVPVVTSPTKLATISNLHPTFNFTLPSYANRPYTLTLQRVDLSFFDVNTTIDPIATSWTVPADLAPGHEYEFDVYLANIFPGFQFSPATDTSNQSLDGFGGGGNLIVEEFVPFFTPVPEPVAIIALVPSAYLVSRGRRKPRRQD